LTPGTDIAAADHVSCCQCAAIPYITMMRNIAQLIASKQFI